MPLWRSLAALLSNMSSSSDGIATRHAYHAPGTSQYRRWRSFDSTSSRAMARRRKKWWKFAGEKASSLSEQRLERDDCRLDRRILEALVVLAEEVGAQFVHRVIARLEVDVDKLVVPRPVAVLLCLVELEAKFGMLSFLALEQATTEGLVHCAGEPSQR